MTGPIPPVNVSFTAGGTEPVAAAVRALTSEIKGLGAVQRSTARDSSELAAAGKKVATQFSQTGAALASLGTAIGVTRLAGLITSAIDTGDAIFKLSQKTGVSTEALSVLAFAGKTANLSLDDLGTSLKFLSKSLGALQRGDPEISAAFHGIGLAAKDLTGLSLDQALQKIADAQSRFADSSTKAEVALRLFGRNGTEVIPFLNDLANGGFDKAAEAAKRLGIVWSREAAKGAQDFNDSVIVLKASLQGLAGELAKETTPGLTKVFQEATRFVADLPAPLKDTVVNLIAVEGAVVGVASAFRLLSIAGVGVALTNPVTLTILGLGAVAAVLLSLGSSADQAKQKYAAFLETLQTPVAIDAERARLELLLKENAAATESTKSDLQKLGNLKFRQRILEQIAALDARQAALGAATGDGRPTITLPDPAAIAARLAAQKDAAHQELVLEQDRIRALDQLNQEQFDRGLEGTKLFFQRRIGLIREATDAEIAALEKERAIVLKTPAAPGAESIKKTSDLTRLDNQITQRRTEGETQVDAALEQQRVKERALAEEVLGFEAKIQQAKGQTLAQALAAIDLEAQHFDLVLKQDSSIPAKDRGAKVEEFRSALTQRAEVQQLEVEVQTTFGDIDAERQRIANEVSIGTISALQGQQRLADFEAARLPTLQQLADQMAAFADQLKDPALAAAAQQLQVQVQGVAAAADLAGQRSAELKAGIEGGFSTFLTDLQSSTASIGDAFRSLLQDIQRSLAEFSTKKILAGLENLGGTKSPAEQLVASDFGVAAPAQLAQTGIAAGAQAVGQTAQLAASAAPVTAAAAALGGAAAAVSASGAAVAGGAAALGGGAAALTGVAGAVTASAGALTSSGGVLLGAAAALSAAAAALAAANATRGLARGGPVPGFALGGVLARVSNGEWELPPATHAHYGTAFLERIRTRQIPREQLEQRAQGGPIRGPGSETSDSILTRLAPGAYIQPGRAVRYYGAEIMANLTARRIPRYLVGAADGARHLRFPRFAGGGAIDATRLNGIRASLIAPVVRIPTLPSVPTLPDRESTAGQQAGAPVEQILRILVESHPDVILRVLASPEGQKVQVETSKQHLRQLGKVLGRG